MRIYDKEEAEKLNPAEWQTNLLKLNPDYTCWGPHEDYMTGDRGWSSRQFYETWEEFGPWDLDDLNECANFYFSIDRGLENCPTCDGDGYHQEAKKVVNTFYTHMNSAGIHWDDKITEDELQALKDAERINEIATLDKVNNSPSIHDAINRSILIEARLKRLGLKRLCEQCNGDGYIYTAPKASVSLTLWILHPRKGCSRGVEIKHVKEKELPAIFRWLREAKERNNNRFAKIP